MAITRDSNGGFNGTATGVTTLDWLHNCTVSGCAVFASVTTTSGSVTTTGVTYDGVAMTKLGSSWKIISAGGAEYTTWYIMGAPTGSKTCTATFSASTNNPGASSIAYTEATTVDSHNDGSNLTNADANLSKSITTTSDNCQLVMFIASVGALTSASGTTDETAGSFGVKCFVSTALKTPAGAYTVDVTIAGADYRYGYSLFAISAAPSISNILFRMT